MSEHREMLPATIAVGLLQTARGRGLNPDPWLAAVGLRFEAVDQADARISYRQSLALIEAAVSQAPGLPLGIEVGTRSALAPMGMLGFGMMACRSVRDAVDFGLAHHRASGSLLDFVVQLDAGDGNGYLRLAERRPEPIARRFLHAEFLASVHLLLHAMMGPDWRPKFIDWPYPAPSYLAAYRQVFDCPQRFDAGRCALAFDPELLNRPLTHYSETNRQLAVQACERLALSIGLHDELPGRVRGVVRAHLPARVDSATIAASLHLSERSLRRRLAERDCRLGDLREAEWADYARRQLDQAGSTVAAVAELMQFGDVRQFRRAYKRWTGRAPRGASATARSQRGVTGLGQS